MPYELYYILVFDQVFQVRITCVNLFLSLLFRSRLQKMVNDHSIPSFSTFLMGTQKFQVAVILVNVFFFLLLCGDGRWRVEVCVPS